MSVEKIDKAYHVLRKAIELEYRLNSLRYKFGLKILRKLLEKKSKLLEVDVAGYPVFIWNDKIEGDIFVEAPSLTGQVEGYMAHPKWGIKGRSIIPLNWEAVWYDMKPEFIYNKDVMDSIRELLGFAVNLSFNEDVNITEYAGTIQYGPYHGFYRITAEGIVIEWIDPGLNKILTDTVAVPDGGGCNVRNVLNSLIMDSSKIRYKCADSPKAPEYETDYSPGLCGSLDQVITYIRQFLDKTLFCVKGSPRELLFIDGPLEGLMITGVRDGDIIWYSDSGSGIININTIREMYSQAMIKCAEMMKMRICPYLPGGPNYPI